MLRSVEKISETSLQLGRTKGLKDFDVSKHESLPPCTSYHATYFNFHLLSVCQKMPLLSCVEFFDGRAKSQSISLDVLLKHSVFTPSKADAPC